MEKCGRGAAWSVSPRAFRGLTWRWLPRCLWRRVAHPPIPIPMPLLRTPSTLGLKLHNCNYLNILKLVPLYTIIIYLYRPHPIPIPIPLLRPALALAPRSVKTSRAAETERCRCVRRDEMFCAVLSVGRRRGRRWRRRWTAIAVAVAAGFSTWVNSWVLGSIQTH